MSQKTSTYYQRRYRERLKAQGFIKKEVWIPPEYSDALKAIEDDLREGVVPVTQNTERISTMSQVTKWNTHTLLEALRKSDLCLEGAFEVELIEGIDPSLHITMREYGDLPIFLSVCGSQIIVDTLLWPVEDIKDPQAFNRMLLQTHKLFPLTACGITKGPQGKEYYEMFGTLSSGSILPSILVEIEALADNAMQAVEAYKAELKNF